MRPVSAAFLDIIRGSHRMVVEARVVAPGLTGTDPDGTAVTILDGDVLLDGTANVRSTLDLTIGGTGLWPTRADSRLAPYGNEIFCRRGVRIGSGATEWVSLGYYRIETANQAKPPDGAIQLAGSDRMAGIVEARLASPVQFPAATLIGDVVEQLVAEVYPWATIEWDDATDGHAVGRDTIAEQDRHGFINDLLTARGKIWYWDHRGVLVIKDVPASTAPVWDVNAGRSGVLITASRTLTRKGVYNAVVATGDQGTDTAPPGRAVVVDNNPASPTYWDGTFGKVPRFYSSPFITDDGQATDAAKALLRKSLGLPYSADFTAVPNAALEPYDPVAVRFSGRAGRETHVLQQVTIPLVADVPLSASTREQTVILLGVG